MVLPTSMVAKSMASDAVGGPCIVVEDADTLSAVLAHIHGQVPVDGTDEADGATLRPVVIPAPSGEAAVTCPPVLLLTDDGNSSDSNESVSVVLSVPPDAGQPSQLYWVFEEAGGHRRQGTVELQTLPLVEAQTKSQTKTKPARQGEGQYGEGRCLVLPFKVPVGRHRLVLYVNQNPVPACQCWVIRTSASCYSPPAFEQKRLWGIHADLWSLRSQRNWGVGDFTDVSSLIRWAGQNGAGFVRLTPLHQPLVSAYARGGTERIQRYGNRFFYNRLFIDVEAVDEFAGTQSVRNMVHSPAFQSRLETVRQAPVLDAMGVYTLKLDVLRRLFEVFVETHLNKGTRRANDFNAYVASLGEAGPLYAAFEALGDRFWSESAFPAMASEAWRSGGGEAVVEEAPAWHDWRDWPEAYRDCRHEEVQQFIKTHGEQIQFYLYMQWLAHDQLTQLGHHAWQQRLSIGLMTSVEVSPHPFGAETWVYPDMVLPTMRLDTGPVGPETAPLNPVFLRACGYEQWQRLLSQAMQPAGAVVLEGLGQQLSGVWHHHAHGQASALVQWGCADELLAILAGLSRENRCLILSGLNDPLVDTGGQDAGGPFGIRLQAALWSVPTSVGMADTEEIGEAPTDELVDWSHRLQGRSMVSLTPVLAGLGLLPISGLDLWSFWHGHDVQALSQPLEEAGLQTWGQAWMQAWVRARVLQRMAILSALDDAGLLPSHVTTDPTSVKAVVDDLALPVYTLLARTEAQLVVFNPLDVVGDEAHATAHGLAMAGEDELQAWPVSGSTTEAALHDEGADAVDGLPRWPLPLEEVLPKAEASPTVAMLGQTRPSDRVDTVAGEGGALAKAPVAMIPLASYRLQFNQHFTLKAAQAQLDYLKALGVSHCYASPLLSARPGSNHGYDITDHHQFNAELGSESDFVAFTDTLRQHDMKLLVDVVPNHMAIGAHNDWWVDVLEHGPLSAVADYFDIAWTSVKPELQGKVLLPVLGASYGRILDNGELRLRFDADQGRFSLHYYDHRFPINPASYATVLGYRLDVLTARLGPSHEALLEYLSVLKAFEYLPEMGGPGKAYTESETGADTGAGGEVDPVRVAERLREEHIAQRRLAQLCRQQPEVPQFIEENLADFHYHGQDPTRLNRLHQLLEQQYYRLAYWRVALDEINYRRFFDVNDLAALRVEDPRVFEATHQYLLKWVEADRIHGLRIDHPDGLYDPAGYFEQLQADIYFRRANRRRDAREAEAVAKDKDRLPCYVVVEKILAHHEHLPAPWPVHGTTGYEFANLTTGFLVAAGQQKAMTRIYHRFLGSDVDYAEGVFDCKKLIMDTSLASELSVLAHQLNHISEQRWDWRDYTLNTLRKALREVVACFPVYRTYVTPRHCSRQDADYVDWAVTTAKKRATAIDPAIYDFIRRVLLLAFEPGDDEAFRAEVSMFAQKFQQYTGPVMAKSFEDTFFYRYNRLVALNEVGGHPDHFGVSINAFHYRNSERLRWQPHSFLNLSTHDAKRSGDVRARLAVLSEIPLRWGKAVAHWATLTQRFKTHVDGVPFPDRNTEYLFYQTLIGLWPATASAQTELPDLSGLCLRLEAYMLKAAREAKVHTSWVNQNQAYEQALAQFIQQCLNTGVTNRFLEAVAEFARPVVACGYLNSVAQQMLLLTVPGVPDVYQGNEDWCFQLVDPDNRHPADFDRLRALQRQCADRSAIDPAWLASSEAMAQSPLKWFVTRQLMQLRQTSPDLFLQGAYEPLKVAGAKAGQVMAFIRHHEGAAVLVVVSRFHFERLGPLDDAAPLTMGSAAWGNTTLKLPKAFQGRTWQRLLGAGKTEGTGEGMGKDEGTGKGMVTIDKQIAVADCFDPARGPWAVLTVLTV
ncbi:MAG: malto-oligosyltrehalose synthase [Cyanobacteria bacterium HKST-UBA03]|nr:malto-oligosyltrehalose synthase [Cyanobacteria bacterium HKST-UBA03]